MNMILLFFYSEDVLKYSVDDMRYDLALREDIVRLLTLIPCYKWILCTENPVLSASFQDF